MILQLPMNRKIILLTTILLSFIACNNNDLQEVDIIIKNTHVDEDLNNIKLVYCCCSNLDVCYSKNGVISTDFAHHILKFLFTQKEWSQLVWVQLSAKDVAEINIEQFYIKDIVKLDAKNILNEITTWKNNVNIDLYKDNMSEITLLSRKSNVNNEFFVTLSAPSFYKYQPISFQLFFRLSLLATFLILILIFLKQVPIQRFLLFTIALFLASIPLKMNYTDYPMGFMVLSIVIAFIYNKPLRFIWQPIFYVLCAIYLLNVIGLSYTGDLKTGLKRLDTTVVLLLFPVVFSMIQFTKENMILLLRFFVWSVIAFCVFGLLSYATIVPEFTWNMAFKDSKMYAPLLMMWPAHPHPSFLSTILLMAVPVALYLRYDSSFKFQVSSFKFQVCLRRSLRSSGLTSLKASPFQFTVIETLLGVLLPIVFTILCGARVGMVIAPVLLGLGYLFYCKFRPVLKCGLVVAGIVASCILLHLYPKADDRFVDSIRVDLRKTAVSAIKEKPVFGWGTGSAKQLIHSEERAHSLGIEVPYDFNQFHNQYLEDWVQFGIPGILILLVLFGWMLWVGIHEKNYLLLSLLAIYMLFCWTEAALFVAKGVLPFTFWLCLLMANRNAILVK